MDAQSIESPRSPQGGRDRAGPGRKMATAPAGVSGRGCSGGDDGNRTHDPLLAKQVLCQLSYVPELGRLRIAALGPTRCLRYRAFNQAAAPSPAVRPVLKQAWRR